MYRKCSVGRRLVKLAALGLKTLTREAQGALDMEEQQQDPAQYENHMPQTEQRAIQNINYIRKICKQFGGGLIYSKTSDAAKRMQ